MLCIFLPLQSYEVYLWRDMPGRLILNHMEILGWKMDVWELLHGFVAFGVSEEGEDVEGSSTPF